MAARRRDDIAEDRGGRLAPAGAGAVEHERASRCGLDVDSVVSAAHARERMLAVDEGRVDAHRDRLAVRPLAGELLARRQELDDVAGVLRVLDRGGVDRSDTLTVHGLERHVGVEGEAGEDGRLLRGVVPLDIGRRIRLGVPERLGVGEYLVEVGTLTVHAVEDVVRRAVDDAEDASDVVAGEGVLERAQDRDRGRDRCLVGDGGADLVCRVEDLRAVAREQGLVARHDVGTGLQRLDDMRARRLDPTHELDDDVSADDQLVCVCREQLLRQLDVARCVDVTDSDSRELESGARALRKLVRVVEKQARDLRPDGSGSEQRDAQSSVFDHSSP